MSHKIVCRENIIANIKIGNIIAFVYEDIRGKIMLSGKVVGILDSILLSFCRNSSKAITHLYIYCIVVSSIFVTIS